MVGAGGLDGSDRQGEKGIALGKGIHKRTVIGTHEGVRDSECLEERWKLN